MCGSTFVGFVIMLLADRMCSIESMYLCNCIVRPMANSFLEEKKIYYLHAFVSFLFKEENVYFVFCLCFFAERKKKFFSFTNALRQILVPALTLVC